jgi:hypothetical protein
MHCHGNTVTNDGLAEAAESFNAAAKHANDNELSPEAQAA